MNGTVKLWKFSYGFITNDETGKDIFVHKNNLSDGLQELEKDQKVSYEVEKDEKANKEQAINVKVI